MAVAVGDQTVEVLVGNAKTPGEGLTDRQLGSLMQTQMEAEGALSVLNQRVNGAGKQNGVELPDEPVPGGGKRFELGSPEAVTADKARISFLRRVINRIRGRTGF